MLAGCGTLLLNFSWAEPVAYFLMERGVTVRQPHAYIHTFQPFDMKVDQSVHGPAHGSPPPALMRDGFSTCFPSQNACKLSEG